MNILIAGFQHEANTFAPTMASYSGFVQGEDFPPMVRGADVLGLRDVDVRIGSVSSINMLRNHRCAG